MLFLWAIVINLTFALRIPSPMWINIASKKSFQSIRSLSTQSSSQSHTRFISFLTNLLLFKFIKIKFNIRVRVSIFFIIFIESKDDLKIKFK